MKVIKKNVRLFNGFNEYDDYYEKNEHKDYVTDIVEYEDRVVADAEYSVKDWKTAVRRLAKATGWDWILMELEATEHFENFLPECDGVAIEIIDDDRIYIAARQYK